MVPQSVRNPPPSQCFLMSGRLLSLVGELNWKNVLAPSVSRQEKNLPSPSRLVERNWGLLRGDPCRGTPRWHIRRWWMSVIVPLHTQSAPAVNSWWLSLLYRHLQLCFSSMQLNFILSVLPIFFSFMSVCTKQRCALRQKQENKIFSIQSEWK